MTNNKKYRVKLTESERDHFQQVLKGQRGKLKIAAWKLQRANALLKCDEGEHGPAWEDQQIADALGITTRSLENWRKQAVLEGPLSLLERKPQQTPPTPAKLDGEAQARLVKLACSHPPDGYARWSLNLLAEKLVELEIVDAICPETVRQAMKKMS